MDTTTMIPSEDSKSKSAIYLWLSSIFWPGAYPPQSIDQKLNPFVLNGPYYGIIPALSQSGNEFELYWHTDNYKKPTWMAFTERNPVHHINDTAQDAFKKSDNILFWDNTDYQGPSQWSSRDNEGSVALLRYKKALEQHIYPESINLATIRWRL